MMFCSQASSSVNDVLFSGILFCMLPTMFLVPKLYGKIEPLLGMRPRDEKTVLGSGGVSAKTVVICIIGFIAAVAAELLATGGFELIDWEASWAESTQAMIVAIIAAAVVATAGNALRYRKVSASEYYRDQGSDIYIPGGIRADAERCISGH